MKIIKTSDIDSKSNLVLYGIKDAYIIQDTFIDRLRINKCSGLVFPNLHIVPDIKNPSINPKFLMYYPAIQIMSAKHINFESIMIKGNTLFPKSMNLNNWNKYTKSGIDNRGDFITFSNVHMENVHDGIINRGKFCNFNKISIDGFSGDAFFNASSNNVYNNLSTRTPLKTLDYKYKHRDIFQIAALNKQSITDIIINGLTHTEGNINHPFYKTNDAGFIHTDGILYRLNGLKISIISDIDYHGFSSVCLRDSKIDFFTLITRNAINDDAVHIDNRKNIGKSYGNKLTFA